MRHWTQVNFGHVGAGAAHDRRAIQEIRDRLDRLTARADRVDAEVSRLHEQVGRIIDILDPLSTSPLLAMTAGCPGKVGWSLPSVGWCYAAASMEAIYMASLKGFAMSPSSLPPTGPYIMRCLYSRTLESRDFSMLHALSVQKKICALH